MTLCIRWLKLALAALLAGCAQVPPPLPISAAEPTPPERSAPAPPAGPTTSPTPATLPAEPALADYLAQAALGSPALAAAFHQWKAALEAVARARALPDPKLTYAHYIREVETRVGPQRNSLQLAQMVPWLGKLQRRGDAAMEAANAAGHRYEARKLRLFHEVKDAYYEYYHLGRAVAVAQENVRLLEHLEGVVRTRYQTGATRHADFIRLQVELGRLQDRLRSLRDLRGPAAARLQAAIGLPVGGELPWPKEIEPAAMDVPDEQLVAWAAERNPDLKALQAELAHSREQVELAREEYFPDVTLGLTWIETGGAVGPMHPSDSGTDPLIAMVTVNVPVWWEKLAAGVREARSREMAALKQKADAANSLSARVRLAAYRHRDAQGKIDLYRRVLIRRASESLKVTEAAFRGGTAGFSDLIDAQRVLLDFQLSYERALADRARHLAELEMLTGRPLPRTAEPPEPPETMPSEAGPPNSAPIMP